MKNNLRHKKSIVSFTVIFFLIIGSIIYIHSYSYTTIGYSNIENKIVDGNNYYIYVNHDNNIIKMQCTKQEYENIVIDNELAYGISYISNTQNTHKGELLYLHFDDTLDNRLH